MRFDFLPESRHNAQALPEQLNHKSRWLGTLVLLPVVCVLACGALRFALGVWLGPASPLSLFFLAVMAAAIYGGMWTGLITTLLSLVVGRFFFFEPQYRFTLDNRQDILTCLMFGVVGIGVSLMSSRLSELRRRSEQQADVLREREARLRGLWENEVVGVFHWDLDGRVFDANDAYLRITGYTREDLDSGRVNWINMTPPEHRPRDFVAIEELHARGHDTPFEKEYLRKDGSRVWVQLAGAITRGTSGVSYCLDIHERKLAEQAVREREERLRLAGEAAEIGFWTLDLTENKLSIDATSRRLFELPAEGEITREQARARIHPDDLDATSEASQRAIAARQPLFLEFRVVLRNGMYRWLMAKGDTVYDRNGNLRKLTGIHWDITARKLAERERDQLFAAEREARTQAERANRIKDEFLATISHELRTPLNAVLGWAQVLKRSKDRTGMIDDGLDIIERNARAQAKLIEDLLDMSRIISGKVKLEIQPLNLAQTLDAAIESIRPSADLKEIRIDADLGAAPAPISGDATRLQQVFWNLLSNAVKFTPKKGWIRVQLHNHESSTTVRISDNGIGMQPTFIAHAFDRFSQADAATTRRFGGLGLGLSIVRHLVELHGGEVSAESAGENKGSTFSITLPLATRSHEKIGDGDAPPLDSAIDLAGIRVLAVDDESDSRQLINQVLRETGARVVEASSADEAIAALQSEKPHLIISDIGMPGVDGFELIRRIRGLPPADGGGTPAIALTAFARPEDRERALHAGFQMHIAKPLNAAEVISGVALLTRPQHPA